MLAQILVTALRAEGDETVVMPPGKMERPRGSRSLSEIGGRRFESWPARALQNQWRTTSGIAGWLGPEYASIGFKASCLSLRFWRTQS